MSQDREPGQGQNAPEWAGRGMGDDEARKMGVDGGTNSVAKMDVDVKVGDIVEIIEGSLSSFVGKVKEVDSENQKVTCLVEMFGRESEVELSFDQIRVGNN